MTRRRIVHSARFERELAALIEADRVRDALRAIHFFVERHPERGRTSLDGYTWAVTTRGQAWGTSEIVVFYVFDEEEVELLGISRADI